MNAKENIQSRNRLAQILSACGWKYIFIAALVVFVVLMFVFNTGSSKPFEEVESSIESQIDTSSLVKANDQTFKQDYGLNAADYEGVMLYVSSNYLEAQEILLVEVKNDDQLLEVEEAIDKRIENRRNDFEGYIPEQVLLLDDAIVTIRGNYIFLVISEDAEAYQQAFVQGL